MDILITDDMISSGESLFDVAKELKKRKANRIFSFVTYGIFTNGLEKFDKAYEEGLIDGVLCTNLTYASEELRAKKWYHEVNCSKYIAYIIAAINHNTSVGDLLDPHDKIVELLKESGWNK
jgi:ribose-phosphate pyrophosphokinase